IIPSDMRFLDEFISCDSSNFLSSAAMDEQTDDIAVLVAESEEPYRQVPLISTCHFPCLVVGLVELRSDRPLPGDEWFDSSSTTSVTSFGEMASISELTGRSDAAG